MYNTDVYFMPAYTNREFVNFGLHKENDLYNYKFTTNDRNLLLSGAISLFPKNLYEYKVSHDTILKGKKFVEEYRLGGAGEGGVGATVVTLK